MTGEGGQTRGACCRECRICDVTRRVGVCVGWVVQIGDAVVIRGHGDGSVMGLRKEGGVIGAFSGQARCSAEFHGRRWEVRLKMPRVRGRVHGKPVAVGEPAPVQGGRACTKPTTEKEVVRTRMEEASFKHKGERRKGEQDEAKHRCTELHFGDGVSVQMTSEDLASGDEGFCRTWKKNAGSGANGGGQASLHPRKCAKCVPSMCRCCYFFFFFFLLFWVDFAFLGGDMLG